MKYFGTMTDDNDLVNKKYVDESVSESENIIANEYSSSSTYSEGDYVIYNGNLYRCTTTISTPEDWNSTHWVQTTVGEDLSDTVTQEDLEQFASGEIFETRENRTINSIDWEWTGTNFTAKGTPTTGGRSIYTLVAQTDNLPAWIVPGKNIYFSSGKTSGTIVDAFSWGITFYDSLGYDLNVLSYEFATTYNKQSIEVPENTSKVVINLAVYYSANVNINYGAYLRFYGQWNGEAIGNAFNDVANEFSEIETEVGGVKSVLNVLDDTVFSSVAITSDWVQGSINTSTGGNAAYKYSIRTGYTDIGAETAILIATQIGYRSNIYFYAGSTYISDSRVSIFETTKLVPIPATATRWRVNLYAISDYEGGVDVADKINQIATHINLQAMTPKLDKVAINGVVGLYGRYPKITRNGNDYDVVISGYPRAIWAGGQKTSATKVSEIITLTSPYVLLYTPDTDAFTTVTMASMGLYKNSIPLLLNSHGALFGPWATFYTSAEPAPENSNIPSYYNTYLDGKISDIEAKSLLLSDNSSRFFFITDYHINGNQRYSPALISDIGKRTGITRTVFGGDAIQSFATKSAAYAGLCDFINDFSAVKSLQDLYLMTGNHEYNNPSADPSYTDRMIDAGAIYRLYFDQMRNITALGDAENSFYYDEPSSKIRFYCLGCTYNAIIGVDTRRNFGNSLLTVPSGYSVFVISHIGMSGGVLQARFEQIMQMCKALNDGTSVTINYTESLSDTFDYSGNARTVIGALCGHIHHDDYFIYDSRFPVVATTCDANSYFPESYPAPERVDGTIYEQAFDVVQIDLASNMLYLTRIGAGNDRTFKFGVGAGLITA